MLKISLKYLLHPKYTYKIKDQSIYLSYQVHKKIKQRRNVSQRRSLYSNPIWQTLSLFIYSPNFLSAPTLQINFIVFLFYFQGETSICGLRIKAFLKGGRREEVACSMFICHKNFFYFYHCVLLLENKLIVNVTTTKRKQTYIPSQHYITATKQKQEIVPNLSLLAFKSIKEKFLNLIWYFLSENDTTNAHKIVLLLLL